MTTIILRIGSKDVVECTQSPIQLFDLSEVSNGSTALVSISDEQTQAVPLESIETCSPWLVFTSNDISRVQISVSLTNQEGQVLARSALLHSDVADLHGTLSRPLFSSSLSIIGTVTFSYHLVTPYTPPTSTKFNYTSFSTDHLHERTLRIGHRGSGNSSKALDDFRAHFQENTLLSFQSAAEKCDWIELDVQLTADDVPILLHDWFVIEQNQSEKIDEDYTVKPVYDVKLRELWKMTDHVRVFKSPQPVRKSLDASPIPRVRSQKSFKTSDHFHDDAAKGQHSRRPLTSKNPKVINPLPLPSIRDVIPTLEKVLQALPSETGLNIEVKYPDGKLWKELEDLSYPERNHFCDIILDICFKYGKTRPIVFSSFDPDVCACLKFKQSIWPVFYLSTAGHEEHHDKRMMTIDDAIDWVSLIGLDGIVSECSVLVENPELIEKVKAKGLVLWSYGGLNNSEEAIKKQLDYKIDGIISDSIKNLVKVIPRELTEAVGNEVSN
ncbi:hypothetical protein P9112_009765 [Eukaryota sp. TZLM1-RC]